MSDSNRTHAEISKDAARLKQERARSLYDRTHSAVEISKLPKDTRYWALEQTSMTYDSGYGDHGRQDMCTQNILNVIWFEDEEALEAWVIKATEERKSYRIFRAEPVKTEVKAVFSVVK